MSSSDFRIASIPSELTNPYLELLYAALKRSGIQLVRGLEVSDSSLDRYSDEIDAIHLHWPEGIWRWRGEGLWNQIVGLAGLWRYLTKAHRLRIAILWTIHNLEHHEGSTLADRIGYRLLARHSSLCICHSRWARDEAVARYAAPSDLTIVMYHGNYDGAYPSPGSREETLRGIGLEPSRRTLVCFGGLRPYKGLEEMLAAVARLPSDRYQLIVAGKPVDPEWFGRVWSDARPGDNVRLFADTVDASTLADLIHASDCILLPYRKITGSGALLMALTFGRAVVASDLPYFREVLSGEPEAAVFCEPGEIGSIEDAVHRFFSVPPEVRHSAARRLAALYAWERVVAPLAERLGDIPRKPPGRTRTAGQSSAASRNSHA